MKIVYLLGSLNRGGTETLLLDVFRNAKRSGLNAVGIYRKPGALESHFVQTDVKMTKLPFRKNIFSYLFRLRKLIIKSNSIIVHAQQPLDALLARIACVGLRLKIILTLHGYDFNEGIAGKMILRCILKRTDANIYVSETQRQYYQKKYKLEESKQTVVYNGVSFAKLQIDLASTEDATLRRIPGSNYLRMELELSSEMLLFGTVGNFLPGRDPLSICRFLKLFNENNKDFHFIFIGKKVETSAHLYDECVAFCAQNNLSDKVTFLGSREDVPGILQQLDAFIYATDHDTFGIGVVEAMAVGLPVFVNDWEVMTEITENGEYATIYKTKDEQDLLRHFLLFLQDKTSFVAKANNASSFVRNKFSIEKHIENLKQIYNNSL